MKLNIKACALASGIMWGVGLLVIAWWMILIEGGSSSTTVIGQMYPGYNYSPTGSFVGLLWGLADGAVCGAAFAWLYNRFLPSSVQA